MNPEYNILCNLFYIEKTKMKKCCLKTNAEVTGIGEKTTLFLLVQKVKLHIEKLHLL